MKRWHIAALIVAAVVSAPLFYIEPSWPVLLFYFVVITLMCSNHNILSTDCGPVPASTYFIMLLVFLGAGVVVLYRVRRRKCKQSNKPS